MKKAVLKCVSAAAALSIAICGLSGCGKGNSDVTDSQGRTKLSIGSWPGEGDPAREGMADRKARFEKANPDFAIVPDDWTFDLKSFYAKAAGGQLPTVYNTNFTEVKQIAEAGYGADLTSELKKQGLYDLMNKDVLSVVSNNGKVYAYPFGAYVLGLAYNVDMFQKAGLMNADGTPMQPKTWDEVAEFAVKIKDATGNAGFMFPTANNYGGWIFTSLAWSFGTEFMKKDDSGNWKATFDSPETAAALQWIKDLKWKYDVLPASTFIDGAEQYKLYGTNQAAMFISAGDLPSKLTAYDMNPESIGIMAIPAGPKKWVTLMGGSVYAVSNNATDKQIEGAIKWIKTQFSPELTDDIRSVTEETIDTLIKENVLVTIKSMSPWSTDSEAVKFENDLRDKRANGNVNHVKLYNDFVADLGDCRLQPEEPVCAQELYAILDGCIQAVLTDKNADPAALLKKANSDFQSNYLDNIDY